MPKRRRSTAGRSRRARPGWTNLLLTRRRHARDERRLLAERPAKRADVKVLFMSGYTDESVIQHGTVVPGTPFILKPFKAAELAAEVSALLSRERQPV